MGLYQTYYISLFYLLLQLQSALSAEVVFALQTNNDAADTYGSSMVYDDRTHRLYITGGTYGHFFSGSRSEGSMHNSSDCFLGILQLPEQVFMSPKWIRTAQIGLQDVSEACSDLYVSPDNGNIFILGHATHSSSVLSPLTPASQRFYEPSATGLVMNLDRGSDLLGGLVMRSNAVQYPVAIQGNDDESTHLYVASIKSDDTGLNPSFANLKNRANATHLDMTTAGYLPPEYGSNFTILLESLKKLNTSEIRVDGSVQKTLEPVWSREFGLATPDDSIRVSGLLYVTTGILVLSGSTYGPPSNIGSNNNWDDGNDWDGFVSVVWARTGELLRSQHIMSIPNHNDRVLGLCKSDNSTSHIYMVGITEGYINFTGENTSEASSFSFIPGAYRAFILKMNVETMNTLWVSYMAASSANGHPPQIHGMACAVTPDGQDVYMAGTVKDGAVLKPDAADTSKVDAKSHGGDDVFVAQYEALDGTLNFALQIGTSHEDSLGQGNSIVASENGDAIILGNTKGSLMRKKYSQTTTDMFVLSLARKSGHHRPIYEDMSNTGAAVQVEGFSKSTLPYYFGEEMIDDDTTAHTSNNASDSTTDEPSSFPSEAKEETSGYVADFSVSQRPMTYSTSVIPRATALPSQAPSYGPSQRPSPEVSGGIQTKNESIKYEPRATQQPVAPTRASNVITVSTEAPSARNTTDFPQPIGYPTTVDPTYTSNLRTTTPFQSGDDFVVQNYGDSKNPSPTKRKTIAVVVSLILVTNLVLVTGLVRCYFARRKIDDNNRAMPSPYLDENNKMNAPLRTFERWPREIEAASDAGSAENPVIVEDFSDSHRGDIPNMIVSTGNSLATRNFFAVVPETTLHEISQDRSLSTGTSSLQSEIDRDKFIRLDKID